MAFIRNKKMGALILVTLVDALLVWSEAINPMLILLKTDEYVMRLTDWILIVGRILVVLLCYVSVIVELFSIKIKNRRRREFERRLRGEPANLTGLIVVLAIFMVCGIGSAIYYGLNYTTDNKQSMILSIVMACVTAVGLVFAILKTIKNKKLKMDINNNSFNKESIKSSSFNAKERICVFIIQDDYNHYFFKAKHTGSIELRQYVGDIIDDYYLSAYGIARFGGNEYDLFGIKTSFFDKDLLKEIKMEQFESEELQSLLPQLDKDHHKIFDLDGNDDLVA